MLRVISSECQNIAKEFRKQNEILSMITVKNHLTCNRNYFPKTKYLKVIQIN